MNELEILRNKTCKCGLFHKIINRQIDYNLQFLQYLCCIAWPLNLYPPYNFVSLQIKRVGDPAADGELERELCANACSLKGIFCDGFYLNTTKSADGNCFLVDHPPDFELSIGYGWQTPRVGFLT